MITRSIPYVTFAILTAILKKTGGFREISGFKGYKDVALIGTVITNIMVVLTFAEIYYIMDTTSNGKHFGFEGYTDALYYSTVCSSSVGFGDLLSKTKQAKMVTTLHLMIQFFVIVPILIESFQPGD